MPQKSSDEFVCDIFRQDTLSVNMCCMDELLRNASKSSRSHESIFFISHQSKLRVVVCNICKYKQNRCVWFREWLINFWSVNFAKFRCFIRNFATERCSNFEKIVFLWFESPSSTYPIFSLIGVFLTENEFFQNDVSI